MADMVWVVWSFIYNGYRMHKAQLYSQRDLLLRLAWATRAPQGIYSTHMGITAPILFWLMIYHVVALIRNMKTYIQAN